METNKPRASIHVGAGKKSFSAQMGNEAERRGWDEKRYQSKNAESISTLKSPRGARLCPLAPILFHSINASNSVTMNWGSNLTWMQSIPTKLLRTVRTDW